MIHGVCPICAKSYTIGALADLKTFPFCCDRCRLIDLGRWADGSYAIPGGAAKEPAGTGDFANPGADAED
jgi:endogenous inhibitor of DNA gyrase (YacG/DUF329 family)